MQKNIISNFSGRDMNVDHIHLVHSRRIGRSLGIDLVTHKICSLDCVYCEAGATTNLTLERKSYKPFDEIYKELTAFLKTKPKIDYITFSGLGEPTLSSDIGHFILLLKKNWSEYKICLITNSTLLFDEKLQNELLECDLILPSLDAATEEVFHLINRPHIDLKAEMMIETLVSFRAKFKNQIWLEMFFLEGINDSIDELFLLKEACKRIKPDKIQINSLDRAGVFDWVKKVSPQRLKGIAEFFEPLSIEII